MDYRQLPGNPQDAETFTWRAFLEGKDDAQDASEDAQRDSELAQSARRDAQLRSLGALVITGLVLAAAPYALPELSENVSRSLGMALADLHWISPSDFLDLEIPIRDLAE